MDRKVHASLKEEKNKLLRVNYKTMWERFYDNSFSSIFNGNDTDSDHAGSDENVDQACRNA